MEIWENLLFHVSTIESRMPLPYLGGGQKEFGDERPFTRQGNYLVVICAVFPKLHQLNEVYTIFILMIKNIFNNDSWQNLKARNMCSRWTEIMVK